MIDPARVVDVLVEACDLDPADVTPSVTFDELLLDSLSLVELAVRLERALGVPVGDGDFTLDDCAASVAARLDLQVAA